MNANQLNNANLKAAVVLSRAELKQMLKAIPKDGQGGDLNCAVFIAEVKVHHSGTVMAHGLSSFIRLVGQTEYRVLGTNTKYNVQPTILKEPNPMNPEGIEAGDEVRLKDEEDITKTFIVESVGGRHGNKVFCKEIGCELYASCFTLVCKAKDVEEANRC